MTKDAQFALRRGKQLASSDIGRHEKLYRNTRLPLVCQEGGNVRNAAGEACSWAGNALITMHSLAGGGGGAPVLDQFLEGRHCMDIAPGHVYFSVLACL